MTTAAYVKRDTELYTRQLFLNDYDLKTSGLVLEFLFPATTAEQMHQEEIRNLKILNY